MPRLPRPRIGRFAAAGAKVLALGPSGWLLLVRAQVALRRASSLVKGVPQGELISRIAARYTDPSADPADLARAGDIALAVDRAARFGPGRPLCLVRSIALHQLLEAAGISGSRIRVGVRLNERSAFEAHAWVELRGAIVGDDPAYVGSFSPLQSTSEFPSFASRTLAQQPAW